MEDNKKAGRPTVSDKSVRVQLYLKKSIAYRWPPERIKETIEQVEESGILQPALLISQPSKPSLIQTKPQQTAPPLNKLAIARAALLGAEAKTGLSTPTELSEPIIRPFDTPGMDAKMIELWYKVDNLHDSRKALAHRFISLMQEEQCNVQGISKQLQQWQVQCA